MMAFIVIAATTLGASSQLLAQADVDSDLQFAPDEEDLAPKPPTSASPASPTPMAPSAGNEPTALPMVVEESTAPPSAASPLKVDQTEPSVVPRASSDLRIFGRYRLRISAAKPSFDQNLKFYRRLYGKEKAYPQFQADWFAWDWYATLGLSFRMAYYAAEGRAVKSNKVKSEIVEADFEGDAPTATKDDAGPTTLTLLPIQAVVAMQFTPFQRKWLVFEGYAGLEYLYWQETRTKPTAASKSAGASSETNTSTNKTAWIGLAAAVDKGSDDSYTNTGYKKGLVAGAALNILLNGLDERSVASMHGSMRLGYVYLTPFVEVVRPRDDGVSFGRRIYGLGFTFESLR